MSDTIRIEDDDGFVTEWPWPDDRLLLANGDFVAVYEALLRVMAKRLTYRMADTLVAEHTVTWDDDGNPLLDGERIYGRSGGSDAPADATARAASDARISTGGGDE